MVRRGEYSVREGETDLFLDLLEEDGILHDPGAWGIKEGPEFNLAGKV